MAGNIKHFLLRDGRYYARLVVPKKLRPYMNNKSELRTPLGADRRAALRAHPIAVAELMHQITQAERRESEALGVAVAPGRYPLTDAQIALRSYRERLAQDEAARNQSAHYAQVGIDDGYLHNLREGIAGRLGDTALIELVGHRIDHFRDLGNTTAPTGSNDWRALARAVCISEYEALERLMERDEGDYSGEPQHPLLRNADPVVNDLPPVSLQELFRDYNASRQLVGKGIEAERRWKPVFESLGKHLRHDNARRITKSDLIQWRDTLLLKLSPKTVSDVYLAAVRTVLSWAVREDRLGENPAENVRQQVKKKPRSREQGFTIDEAEAILKASYRYEPLRTVNGVVSEVPQASAAKKWVPLLCAFTGARVVEITQLRRQDIRDEEGIFVLRISPDAGTVKTGQYRDVPIHPQIIELGFRGFVERSVGPLFYIASNKKDPVRAARTSAQIVSRWLHKNNLIVQSVAPNHGWRHRFKTVGREVGIQDRVLDALMGHASTTAGDAYGDVTIKTKAKAINSLPHYAIE